MKAVLFDMDGTLVDSEKLWDIAMRELYARHGGLLTPEVRESTVGGSSESVIRLVYADLGLEPDPVEMAATADWLHDITGELFDAGRAWGGAGTNLQDPGWLSNAGIGLRIVSARAAFSNVLHIDLAFPLDAPSDVKKVQLLVKTKTSF